MRHSRFAILLLLPILLLLGSPSIQAQTDIAASAMGAFPSTTKGIYTQQNPADQAGVLLQLRHIWNPLYGYELAYSVNRANQHYTYVGPSPVVREPKTIRAYDHEVTGAWLVTLPLENFRPFALAGGGVNVFVPSAGQSGAQSDTKAVVIYGVGVDWSLFNQVGLRAQFRGNIYKAPDVATTFRPTDRLVHSAEPSIGIFIRF